MVTNDMVCFNIDRLSGMYMYSMRIMRIDVDALWLKCYRNLGVMSNLPLNVWHKGLMTQKIAKLCVNHVKG